MHQPSERWQLGLGLALLTAVLWGTLPVAMSGVLQSMDALTITWFRLTTAAILVGTYQFFRGGFGWSQLKNKTLALYMFSAVAGLLVNYALFVVGLHYSSAEATQVIIQVAPMLLMLVSVWLYKEPFRGWQVIGVILFATGLLLFFHHSISAAINGTGSTEYNLGVLLVLLSAISWVFYGVAQKQLLKHFGSQQILVTIYIAGAFAFFPIAKPAQVLELNSIQLYCLIFASLNTIISYGAFAMALEHWQASRVSAAVGITPLTSLLAVHIAAWAIPGLVEPEALSWISWSGAFMVVAGTMTIALVRAKTPVQPSPE